MSGLLNSIRLYLVIALGVLGVMPARAESARETVNKAILAEDAEEQAKIVSSLAGNPAPEITELFTALKESTIYIYDLPKGAAEDALKERVAITLAGKPDADGKQPAIRLDDNTPLKD